MKPHADVFSTRPGVGKGHEHNDEAKAEKEFDHGIHSVFTVAASG
jgi:hypothetical protein